MVMESKVLISVKELKQILNKVTLLDCRYRLTEPDYGFNEFVKSHIPGAFFMDLNSHLASEVKLTGGRHPLPDIDILKTRLEEVGITNDTSIVCYDDNLSGAGRCWFLLKYMGILNVRVLNGGFDEWNKFGLVVESGPERKVPPGHIDVKLDSGLIVTHEDILNQSNKHKIIDARETYRYEGREEPIDKIAGRILSQCNPMQAGFILQWDGMEYSHITLQNYTRNMLLLTKHYCLLVRWHPFLQLWVRHSAL